MPVEVICEASDMGTNTCVLAKKKKKKVKMVINDPWY